MRVHLYGPVTAVLPAVCAALVFCVLLRQDAVATDTATDATLSLAQRAFDEASAQRCNPRNAAGMGLRGDYFEREGGQGAVLLSRVDATLEFDDTLDWPSQDSRVRPRSARWMGWVKAPLSGAYRFHAGPAARIAVSGLPMAGPAAAAEASIQMEAGRFYPIVIDVDFTGRAGLRLEWTPPHGMRYLVPQAALFLPTA